MVKCSGCQGPIDIKKGISSIICDCKKRMKRNNIILCDKCSQSDQCFICGGNLDTDYTDSLFAGPRMRARYNFEGVLT